MVNMEKYVTIIVGVIVLATLIGVGVPLAIDSIDNMTGDSAGISVLKAIGGIVIGFGAVFMLVKAVKMG